MIVLSSGTQDGTPNSAPPSTPTTSAPLSSTTPEISAMESPAPTDGSCSMVNATSYTVYNSTGATIRIEDKTAPQSFVQVCNTNWPVGEGNGNPNVVDLLSAYVPALEDCIMLCAQFNVVHKMNGGADGSYCRSFNILKDDEFVA